MVPISYTKFPNKCRGNLQHSKIYCKFASTKSKTDMSRIKVTFNAPVTIMFLALMLAATIGNYLTLGMVNNIFGCKPVLSFHPMIVMGYFTRAPGRLPTTAPCCAVSRSAHGS